MTYAWAIQATSVGSVCGMYIFHTIIHSNDSPPSSPIHQAPSVVGSRLCNICTLLRCRSCRTSLGSTTTSLPAMLQYGIRLANICTLRRCRSCRTSLGSTTTRATSRLCPRPGCGRSLLLGSAPTGETTPPGDLEFECARLRGGVFYPGVARYGRSAGCVPCALWPMSAAVWAGEEGYPVGGQANHSRIG